MVGAAALAVLASACGDPGNPTSAQPAPAPRVVMTGPQSGYAVWPSDARWIVLGTSDGWRTVQNRTPLAVPTDGGLVLATDDSDVAVGVLPYQQLTVSPVLQSTDGGSAWSPSQLPAALLASAGSMARSSGAVWAVLAGSETLLTQRDGATGWRAVITPEALDPGGGFSVTGVDFPDGATGFLTGSGPADGPLLFTTDDGGSSWRAVPLDLGGSGRAESLPPCRIGSTWVVPVLADSRLVLFSSQRAVPWSAGPALPASSTPAVACGPDRVWAAVPAGSSDELFRAAPGGAWTSSGALGRHVLSLAVAGPDQAFAATDRPAALLSVRPGGSPTASTVPLPGWVAVVGGGAMRN